MKAEMIEMKTVVINIFCIFQEVEENMNIMEREMEATKTPKWNFQRCKKIISDMKNQLDRINIGLDIMSEKICELEDITNETNKNETAQKD